MPTTKLQLPIIADNITNDVKRDLNALAAAIDLLAGASGGLALINNEGKVVNADGEVAGTAPKDASLTEKGIVQLSNSITGTNEAKAATEKAVKDAKEAAINWAKSFGLGGQAKVITDFNAAIDSGVYYALAGTPGAPDATSSFTLLVIKGSAYSQLAIAQDGTVSVRNYSASSWKPWRKVLDSSMIDVPGGIPSLDETGQLKSGLSAVVRKFTVATGNAVTAGDVVALDENNRIVKPAKSARPVLIDSASAKQGISKATTTAPDALLNTMHVANNVYCVQHRFGANGLRFTLTFFRVLENGEIQFGPVPLIADELTDNRVFGLGISSNFSFVGVSETEAIIRYSEGNANPFLQIIARVVIDPVTLNFSITGKTTLFSQTANYGGTGLVRLSANKYMALYAGTNALLYVVIATWNGTNFSLGTPLQVLGTNGNGFLHVMDSGRVYLTSNNNNAATKVLTVTGTTISAGTDTVVLASQVMQTLQLTPSLFLMIGSGTNKNALVEVMPDNSIVVREQFNVYAWGNSGAAIGLDAGIVAAADGTLVYLKEIVTSTLYAFKIDTQNKKVETASLEKGVMNSTLANALRNTWAFHDGRFVIGEWTATDYRVLLAYPPGEAGRIVGIARETKSEGQTCEVVVNGVAANLTNILPGATYISADGKLKKAPPDIVGTKFKGISTTEVIV